MIKGIESILISSQDAKKLSDFYKKVIGLKLSGSMEIGDKGEKGYEFELKGPNLFIMDHSDIKASAKDPSRTMVNLEVDDIEKEVKRAKKAGAKFKQDIYHVEGYGLIATIKDLDGNFIQFVQVRPTK